MQSDLLVETGYRECKTYLRGPGRRLRGRTPGLARQELWAYLATYQAIRILIARAAARDGRDPARISFTAALHAARHSIEHARACMTTALDEAEREILGPAALVPERPGRVSPRTAKRRHATWPPPHRASPLPRHATYHATITTPATTTPHPPHQPKQPPPPTPQPP
jgi:hypothetical protein